MVDELTAMTLTEMKGALETGKVCSVDLVEAFRTAWEKDLENPRLFKVIIGGDYASPCSPDVVSSLYVGLFVVLARALNKPEKLYPVFDAGLFINVVNDILHRLQRNKQGFSDFLVGFP